MLNLFYRFFNKLINFKTKDYRFLIFFLLLLYISILLLSHIVFGSYQFIADKLGVHPRAYFVDLKILLCGIDTMRINGDPYSSVCLDNTPYFNYPNTWYIFSFFHFFTESNLLLIGVSIGLLFFISLFFLIGKVTLFESIIYSFLFTSPALMLALDRCNSDLIIFLLLFVSLSLRNNHLIFSLLILFTTILKIFPFGSLISIFNINTTKEKKTILFFILNLLILILYFIYNIDNIKLVSSKTPRPFGGVSYGLGEIPSYIYYYLFDSKELKILFPVYLFLGLGLIFKLLFYPETKSLDIDNDKKGTAYLIGSLIFILTCIIGFNWEYRLIFLLFTIPQIFKWFKIKKKISIIILSLNIFIFWQSFIEKILLHFNLDFLNYHYFSQLLVVLLFFIHISICYSFIYKKINYFIIERIQKI